MTPTVNYHDHLMRFVLAIIGAHVMVLYNDPQNFYEAVFTASYIRGFIASFIISYIIVFYIERATRILDKRYDWERDTLVRLIWQIVFGIFVPAFVLFLMVSFFMWIYNINILHTTYLRQDYPLALLMLLVLNLYHFGLYCFIRLKRTTSITDEMVMHSDGAISHTRSFLQPGQNVKSDSVSQTRFKETILINTFDKTIPVEAAEIAYAFRTAGNVFIRLHSMENINDSYQVTYTLKDLEGMLNPSMFFRINRQMLINRCSCIGYRSEKNKTLSLTIEPPIFEERENQDFRKLHIVSEDRCSNFKSWLDR